MLVAMSKYGVMRGTPSYDPWSAALTILDDIVNGHDDFKNDDELSDLNSNDEYVHDQNGTDMLDLGVDFKEVSM